MATVMQPDYSTATVSPRAAKRLRVLACVLCQQRKVKCDRNFPCANCTKASAKCVPATLTPRQRRRRYPERELLERLRHYEDLLRENNIKFEPLHAPTAGTVSTSDDKRFGSMENTRSDAEIDQLPKERTIDQSEPIYEAKSFWHAMNQKESQDPEYDDDDDSEDEDDESTAPHGFREATVKKAMDELFESNDHLLFGSRKPNLELSVFHPEQAQILRLWQTYLENVNPLLEVTHTPTLQARIIDTISDLKNVSPTLEALMFSIYCVSVMSLTEEECKAFFGSPKRDLMRSYQFGCQQALLSCGALRSSDRDCLTALYLYLVSIRPDTDPRYLHSTLAIAIRIAQRMSIHNEAAYSKCSALEAEMRRRLWWSLVMFDHRICELTDYRTTALNPTWDCKIPLNVNAFELRPEMKTAPIIHNHPTEAIFAVVRSELGDFIRHTAFHLDFTNPSLKTIAKGTQLNESNELNTLEKLIEDKYLNFCNPENPLHYMTIWTVRGQLAKHRLIEHYSRYLGSLTQQTGEQRDASISYAVNMLECDTKLMTSPLTKGYRWLIESHFPFPAYVHILQDLRKRPMDEQAEQRWEVLSKNFDGRRFFKEEQSNNPLFKMFSRVVLQAWTAREAVLTDGPFRLPRIVLDIKQKVMEMTPNTQNQIMEQAIGAVGIDGDDRAMPTAMPMDFGDYSQGYGIGGQGNLDIPGQAAMDVDVNQLDWTMIDWNLMHTRGW